jgi:hypothetical protein
MSETMWACATRPYTISTFKSGYGIVTYLLKNKYVSRQGTTTYVKI